MIEQIFSYLLNALQTNINPLVVLIVIAAGYFQRYYLTGWKWSSSVKTLLVSFVASAAYLLLSTEVTKEILANYFFSFFMATSLYEIVLKPITKWLESKFGFFAAKGTVYVVYQPSSGYYLTYYDKPSGSVKFGYVENALTYGTLQEAKDVAKDIGSGTVGTTKPNS